MDLRTQLASSDTLDAACFLELSNLVGRDTACRLLRQLAADLGVRFTHDDVVSVAGDAHAMSAAAGLLGFKRFAEAARALEMSCKERRADTRMFAHVRQMRDDVIAEVDRLVRRLDR